MNKVFGSAQEALADIVKDGQTLAVGGFGLCGIPEALIAALRDLGIKSVEIQHGLISASDYYYVYSEKLKPGLEKALFPDTIGLYGQYWKNILLRGAEWKA